MPLRRLTQPARETLTHFRLREGDTVLEVGPGPGYYSITASHMVGRDGRVLCLDIQPEMAVILRGRLNEAGATSARLLQGAVTQLPLVDHSVDNAFLAAVLGEVPDRSAAIAELRRVIKPGGILGFLETLTDPDYMFRDHLVDLCAAHGFRNLDERRVPLGYSMTFQASRD